MCFTGHFSLWLCDFFCFLFFEMQICSVSFLDGQQAPGGDNRICAHYGVDLSTAKEFLRQSVGGVISSSSFFCRMTPSIFFSCALYPLFFFGMAKRRITDRCWARESPQVRWKMAVFSATWPPFFFKSEKGFPPFKCIEQRQRERESWRDALLVADNGLCAHHLLSHPVVCILLKLLMRNDRLSSLILPYTTHLIPSTV